MLLTTIHCLDDQHVAERMRALAGTLHASPQVADQAADEAVSAYQASGSVSVALGAGIRFVEEATAERQRLLRLAREPSEADPEPALPLIHFEWIERPAVLAIAAGVVAGIVILRAVGLL